MCLKKPPTERALDGTIRSLTHLGCPNDIQGADGSNSYLENSYFLGRAPSIEQTTAVRQRRSGQFHRVENDVTNRLNA